MDYGALGTSRPTPRRAGMEANLSNRVPDSAILRYTSRRIPNKEHWVAARFSPHAGHEHIIALGSEDGKVTIGHAAHSRNSEKFHLESFQADRCGGIIREVNILGGCRPNTLVTLSGEGEVLLWDLQSPVGEHMGKHPGTTCFSSWPHNSNCFITGSRYGSVMAWDRRTNIANHTKRQSSSTSKLGVRPQMVVPPGNPLVTALLCTGDQNQFLLANTSSVSPLCLWDLRYQKVSTPAWCYNVPKRNGGGGVASMCIDRYHANFFAASTNNTIYEYSLCDGSTQPVNSLLGKVVVSFTCDDMKCRASPTADHLLCGSSRGCAVIWDRQEGRHYKQDNLEWPSLFGYRSTTRPQPNAYLPYPKFRLSGHQCGISTVDWSALGRYFLTMDRKTLRVWDAWDFTNYPMKTEENEEPPPAPAQLPADLTRNRRQYTYVDVSQKGVARPQLLRAPSPASDSDTMDENSPSSRSAGEG